MKLNILKLLVGGGLGQLFSAVANPFAATNTLQTEETPEKKSNELVPEDLLKELRIKGLPNEVDEFELKLARLQQRIDAGGYVSSQELASIRSAANRIVKQSSYLDKAIEYSLKNDALGDIAVDQNGYIFSLTENGIKKVAFKDFNAKKDKALTYSELAEYRRNAPSLINDADVILVIGSSVGTLKINTFIEGVLSKIGQTENKLDALETLQALLGKDVKLMSLQEYNAIVNLAGMASKIGLDAVFKTSYSLKNSNVEMACNYLFSILPRNMKALLQGSYIAQGGPYKKSSDYVSNVIQSAVLMASNNSYDYGISFQSDLSKESKGTDPSGKSFYSTPFELFADGNLNAHDAIPISDPDSNNKMGMTVTGQVYAGIFDLYGHLVQKDATLADALKLKLGTVLDMSHAYIGSQKLEDINDLNNIVISGSKSIAAVDMPVNAGGGINWEGFKGFLEAEKEIKERNFTTIEEKNKCHKAHHSYAYYDLSGKLVPIDGTTERYFYVPGYAYSGMLDDDNTLARPLSGVEEDNAETLVKSVYDALPKSSGFTKPRGKGILWWKQLDEVPIFIKIDKNAASNARLNVGHGPLEQASSREDFMLLQLLQEADLLVTSSNILYL